MNFGNRIRSYLMAVVLAAAVTMPGMASAEVVEGQAVIGSAGVEAALEAAKHDAMRNYVEQQVGVKVSATTEVEMGRVVRDNIVAHSDGYVQIKQIVSQEILGDIAVVRVDLEASPVMLDTAIRDVKSRLEMLSSTSNSYGVAVAITGFDENGNPKNNSYLNNLVAMKMQDKGFITVSADAVRAYMEAHPNMEDMGVSAEVRRIGRNTRTEENSLLRGSLSTKEAIRESGYFKVKVLGQFELVGYDSNLQSNYAEYFTAVDKNLVEAERKAEEMAVAAAVDVLGQKALKTEQTVNRGGEKHLKLTLNFAGIADRNLQRQAVLDGLQQAHCRVLRSSFNNAGMFKVFVDATGYETTADLQDEVLRNIAGLLIGNTNEATAGSTQLYFSF
ncbi:MAG: hypothetical protein SPI64_01970 [Anaerovibrio sp.]|nr:hypothetical protein [Selenomonadaceae bacterium]MDY6052881.1 hypothetical protein [Anaerovibrio sp.]